MAGSARISDPDLSGRTVASIRAQYAPVYTISADAVATLNGETVDRRDEAETVVEDGDELLFNKPSGQKGA
jgi:molybdopterin converting factor small subunit